MNDEELEVVVRLKYLPLDEKKFPSPVLRTAYKVLVYMLYGQLRDGSLTESEYNSMIDDAMLKKLIKYHRENGF